MEFSFGLIGFLIVFPLIVAAALLFVRQEGPRRVIVCVSGVVIALASVVLVVMNLGASCTLFAFESMAIDFICTGISVAIAAVIVWFAVRYKNLWAAVLAGVQVVGTLILEFMFSHGIEVPYGLYFDSLSLLMTFIIGVVGSGICIYALGYMEDFQAHEPEGALDRRPTFFALMFVFLSAMYVIVFADHMTWLFTGWEITTVCSFLLIGFTRTEEAIKNAFRQIIMNLLGGISFLIGLFVCVLTMGTLSLAEFLAMGQQRGLDAASKSAITGFITKEDDIGTVESPFGKVQLVQLIGVKAEEIEQMKNKTMTPAQLAEILKDGLTDYKR